MSCIKFQIAHQIFKISLTTCSVKNNYMGGCPIAIIVLTHLYGRDIINSKFCCDFRCPAQNHMKILFGYGIYQKVGNALPFLEQNSSGRTQSHASKIRITKISGTIIFHKCRQSLLSLHMTKSL